MGIETTRLITRDPRTDAHEAQLTSINTRVNSHEAQLTSINNMLNFSNIYVLSSVSTLHTNTTLRSTNSSTFVLLKQTRLDVIVPNNTTVRVSVEARVTTDGLEGFIQFTRNGVILHTQSIISALFNTFTFDIPNCVTNSLIEISGRVIGTNNIQVQNLRLIGEINAITNISTAFSVNTAGVTTPLVATSLS